MAIAAAAVLMVVLGVASPWFAKTGLQDVTGYRSRYASAIEPGMGTTRLTRRLVLVIVDGLAFSGVDEMPALNDIGCRGAAFSLTVSEPSLSCPGWATLLSGAPPEISGVTTNAHDAPVAVDTLFDVAARAGIKAVVAGDEGFEALFGDAVARGAYYKTGDEEASRQADEAVLKEALGQIERAEAGLIVAHFSSLDCAGHASGARSASYGAVAARIDGMISKIVSALDLASTTIIVTSDHGHTVRGGHGGWEEDVTLVPLVAAGAGIVAPARPREHAEWQPAHQADVAPTCAALLGTSVPAHSQGGVMLAALDSPEHAISERLIRQAQARAAFASQYCETVGAKPPDSSGILEATLLHNDGEYEKATELALQADSRIRSAVERGRRSLMRARKLGDAVGGFLVLGVLALEAIALGGAGAADLRVAAAGAAAYFGVFAALVAFRGVSWSLSMFNSEQEVVPFLFWRMTDAAVSAALSAVLMGWLVRRSGRERAAGAFLTALVGVYFSTVVLAAEIVLFVAAYGAGFTWYLPDLHRGVKYYVDVLQIAVLGLSWPVFCAISLGSFWVLRGPRPLRSAHPGSPPETLRDGG